MRFRTFFPARARARELDRLIETQIAIGTSAFDLDAVMTTVVEQALALTGADAAAIELPDGDVLASRNAGGDSPIDDDAYEGVNPRSLLVVPLLHDGREMGVLKVYRARPDAFAARHERILGGLAQLVGTALVRAELITRLEEQAVTDDLTGLPNRRAWYARLDEAIARARRSGGPLTVIVLDLDGFKQVNDGEGHAAGDDLLRAVARSWSSVLREVDVIGRLGGDEFAVVAEGADTTAAVDIVHRLADAHPHRASAGFAIWDGAESADALVGRADTRMYADKRGHAAAA